MRRENTLATDVGGSPVRRWLKRWLRR